MRRRGWDWRKGGGWRRRNPGRPMAAAVGCAESGVGGENGDGGGRGGCFRIDDVFSRIVEAAEARPFALAGDVGGLVDARDDLLADAPRSGSERRPRERRERSGGWRRRGGWRWGWGKRWRRRRRRGGSRARRRRRGRRERRLVRSGCRRRGGRRRRWGVGGRRERRRGWGLERGRRRRRRARGEGEEGEGCGGGEAAPSGDAGHKREPSCDPRGERCLAQRSDASANRQECAGAGRTTTFHAIAVAYSIA